MIVYKQQYSGEEICDMERDISEMFDRDFNPLIDEIPVDDNYIHEGVFEITVTWKPE